MALVRSGWDGAPLNRSFYPVAALSVAALLALLVLETRADVVYPAVYCWAVGAIVVRRKTVAAQFVVFGFCLELFEAVSSDSLSNNPVPNNPVPRIILRTGRGPFQPRGGRAIAGLHRRFPQPAGARALAAAADPRRPCGAPAVVSAGRFGAGAAGVAERGRRGREGGAPGRLSLSLSLSRVMYSYMAVE